MHTYMYVHVHDYMYYIIVLLTVGGCGFQRAQSGVIEGITNAIIFCKMMHSTEYTFVFHM